MTNARLISELIQLQPKDENNQRLVSNVRPPDWANPKPGLGAR